MLIVLLNTRKKCRQKNVCTTFVRYLPLFSVLVEKHTPGMNITGGMKWESARNRKFIKCEKLLLSLVHENPSLSLFCAQFFFCRSSVSRTKNSVEKERNENRLPHAIAVCRCVWTCADMHGDWLRTQQTHHFRYFEWAELFYCCSLYVLCTHMALNVRPIECLWAQQTVPKIGLPPWHRPHSRALSSSGVNNAPYTHAIKKEECNDSDCDGCV